MRVFIHRNDRTPKAIAVFDAKLTSREARPEGTPNLAGITAGMIVRPAGDNGRPDPIKFYEIESVGASVIKLKTARADAEIGVPDTSTS